jgi:PAS domain S-box-containing protein
LSKDFCVTLRKKTLLFTSLLLAATLAIIAVCASLILLDGFRRVEATFLERNVERAQQVIDDDLTALDSVARDWAQWDDTCAFIENPNEKYLDSNLTDASIGNIHLNLMAFVSPSGNVVFCTGYDPAAGKKTAPPGGFMDHLRPGLPLVTHSNVTSRQSGILLLPDHPVLLVSRPILNSNAEGPVRGALIVGRTLDESMLARFHKITRQPLRITRIDQPQLPADMARAYTALAAGRDVLIALPNTETIAGYILRRDIYGKPALIMRVDQPRTIYFQGQQTLFWIIVWLAAGGILFSLIILRLLEKFVLNRLADFSAGVDRIRHAQDMAARVSVSGADEIGHLARNVNAMLDAIQQTERQRAAAEAQLRDSERRYRMLFNTMTEGFALHEMVYDADGKPVDYRFLVVNPAFEELTGLKSEQIIGKTVREVIPGIEESWIRRYGEVARGGTSTYFEDYSRELNRYYSVLAFRPAENQFACIFEDVTDRKRAEEEARLSEERFRQLTALAPVGVFLTDAQGAWEYVNRKWSEMAGLPAEAAQDGGWLQAVHSADRESVAAAWKQMLAGQTEWKREYRLQAPTGKTTWVYGLATPLHDAQGGIRGYIGINVDITDRRQAEDDRRKLEAQIQQTQKLESLGILAGGIAHDFNNILMAILGNVDIALMDISPASSVRDNLLEIEKAARRAADLCRQMLAYSGKGRFVIEALSLTELIEEMARMLEVSVSKKAVLRYHLAPGLPAIDADVAQMRQIVMNLVINASEAIGDKSGVISITTGAMHCDQAYLQTTWLPEPRPEGLYVYLEVADTGCGMDKDTLAKIFDPFFTTKFTGRGLGLAAVLGIVRGHGGALKVYSEPNKGTTFKVLFPASNRTAEKTTRACEFSGAWRAAGTVLLVDDEETVRALGKSMLERLGFRVLVAADGREALSVFRAHQTDIVCVLLDLTMPHKDGEETFRELRQLQSDVRVILSSGYNEQEVSQRFVGKGLAGFIQKPYQTQALAAKLRDILGD